MNYDENVLQKVKVNKKIVFFDIDDTLYTPQTGVPDSAVMAIRQLRANGHLAFICTGRAKSMIFPSILEVGFDGIVAGAGTYAEYNGQLISRKDMDGKEAAEAVAKLRGLGFIPIPEGHDYLYYEHRDGWSEHYGMVYEAFKANVGENFVEIPDNEETLQVSKISSLFTENSQYEQAIKVFEDRYTVINHSNKLLELIPKGYSKAEGIKEIMKVTGVQWENTYALGDSMNDYEMISYVKYGVAMGNADERIINIADYVTDTVDKDGVYKVLKHFDMI